MSSSSTPPSTIRINRITTLEVGFLGKTIFTLKGWHAEAGVYVGVGFMFYGMYTVLRRGSLYALRRFKIGNQRFKISKFD